MVAVYHSFRGKRGLVTALGALITTKPADCITVPTATLRTDIAVRPLELVPVLLVGFLSGKPLDNYLKLRAFFLDISGTFF